MYSTHIFFICYKLSSLTAKIRKPEKWKFGKIDPRWGSKGLKPSLYLHALSSWGGRDWEYQLCLWPSKKEGKKEGDVCSCECNVFGKQRQSVKRFGVVCFCWCNVYSQLFCLETDPLSLFVHHSILTYTLVDKTVVGRFLSFMLTYTYST